MATIFVSSTFKDMQHERDALRDLVLPRINSQARAYGQSFDFCDLRWGVNTSDMPEEEASRKVMDVCLNEIDRSEQPMVVLIGERYGWIPDAGLIANVSADRDMALDDLEISCTALEIEFGSFFRKKNTLFYFREIVSSSQTSDIPKEYLSEDASHKAKLCAIKTRIKNLFGDRLRFYKLEWNGDSVSDKSIREFAMMVETDLVTELKPRWQEYSQLSDAEKAMRKQWGFIRQKASMFCAGRQFADGIYSRLTGEEKAVVVQGDSGSGKSTLFSYIAQKFDKEGWVVLPFVSGLNEDSVSSLGILQTTIEVLEEMLGERAQEQIASETSIIDVAKLMHRRDLLCRSIVSSGKKLILMVDAVDQLAPDNYRDDSIFIPGNLDDNLKFFATTLPEVPLRQIPAAHLAPLSNEEKLTVIDSVLSIHGRELSGDVKARIASMQASGNPMFLSLILQRLMVMGKEDFYSIRQLGDDMNAIATMQKTIINTCPDSIQQMAVELIEVVASRINEALIKEVVRYMAVSRRGLRVSDLSVLLSSIWDTADFTHMTNYLQDCFIIREDGRLDFAHRCIREGLLEKEKQPDFIHARLLVYLDMLPALDTVRMSEYMYHCMKADAKVEFIKYFGYYTSNIAHRKRIEELTREAAVAYARQKGLAKAVESFSDEQFRCFALEYGKPLMDTFSPIAKKAMFDCFLVDHGAQLRKELDFMLSHELYDKQALDVIEGFCLEFLDYDVRWSRYAIQIYKKILLIRESEYNRAMNAEKEESLDLLNRLLCSFLYAQIACMNARDYEGMQQIAHRLHQFDGTVAVRMEQDLSNQERFAATMSNWVQLERSWTLAAQSLLDMSGADQNSRIVAALSIMEQRFSLEGGVYDLRVPINDLSSSSDKQREIWLTRIAMFSMLETGPMLFQRFILIARARQELAKHSKHIDEKKRQIGEARIAVEAALGMIGAVEGFVAASSSLETPIPDCLTLLTIDVLSLLKATFTFVRLGIENSLYLLAKEGSIERIEQNAVDCSNMFVSASKSKTINPNDAANAELEIAYTMSSLFKKLGNAQKEEYWASRYRSLASMIDVNNVHSSKLFSLFGVMK